MINTFESVKVLNVGKVDSLSEEFKLENGNGFHVFIAPGSGADKDSGETIIIKAQPVKNAEAVEVPIVVGDWNPVLLRAIAANSEADTDIDLSAYSVYYSEIANY